GVCEDSFSGEDASKPGWVGTLLARQIAVSLVASNLTQFARVTLVYHIGAKDPLLNIYTQGTGAKTQAELEALIKEKFDLSTLGASEAFNLRTPEIYGQIIEASDYFQNPSFPWNQPV